VAEATRLQATAEYLLNRETGRPYKKATDLALRAAKRTRDVELVARALLEQIRCGAEIGDQERVVGAQKRLTRMLQDPNARRIPIVLYAHGYSRRLLGDMPAATRSMRRAIEILDASSKNAVELSLVYNALGMCQYSEGRFAAAESSLVRALELSGQMGDDSRSSIICSNMCVLNILRGRFEDAVEYGRKSVELSDRFGNQPLVTYAYTNLADAYVLSGNRIEARHCIRAARLWNQDQRSWRVDVTYLCESAHLALMMGDPGQALKQIERVEHLAYGRELAVPEQGLFCRLKIFRAAHVASAEHAAKLAQASLDRFRSRNMLYYLEALAALTWVQARSPALYENTTRDELQLFESIGAHGLRALLVAEGFLS
jgi:tetratricopeptide (TPR) repeat protein